VIGRIVLVLGHPYDVGARAVCSEIRWRSADPVLLLPPELAAATGWTHRVGDDGRARTQLRLPNGRRLADEDIGCVLNRWNHLPAGRLTGASERDREYGALEFQSLIASWLAGLSGRVVNRPNPNATDAGPRSPRGWLALAVAAGLSVAPSGLATAARLIPAATESARPLGPFAPDRAFSTGRVPVEIGWSGAGLGTEPADPGDDSGEDGREVLVVGGRAFGAPTTGIGDACVDVANRAGCSIAAFRFETPGRGTVLAHVTTRPALTGVGQAAAVAELCRSIADRAGDRA